MTLHRSAAIVGVGEVAPTREPPAVEEIDLMIALTRDALADAGIDRGEVDGLLVVPPADMPMLFPSLLAERLGIRPTYAGVVDLGGATAAGMLWRAAAAIATGQASTVVCVMASVMDPARFLGALSGAGVGGTGGGGRQRNLMSLLGIGEFEAPYGPMGVNSSYALAARRHMHEFGTTPAQLAKIAVDQRTNACANPMALFGKQEITVDDVLASRLVVDPLHLLEIVRPCSGGIAWVMTSPERAAATAKEPVWLLGAAERVSHSSLTHAPSLTTTAIADTAPRAYEMAGVGPGDIDLVSVYDCYTIMVLLTLEDAGFCGKGKGGPFVEEHDLTFWGDLPVNTHGGQLSYGQPGIAGGASHITEAVRQLRGECGERQVRDCELAFVNGNGGTMSEEVSLILGR